MSEAPFLDERERIELLRIVRVFAKEWQRSGHKPPGAPHRPSLLSPSAAWVRLRTAVDVREALVLAAELPLYEAAARLGVGLIRREAALDAAALEASRFEVIPLGELSRLPAPPDGITPGRDALIVAAGDAAALVPAADALGQSALEHLATCCRAAGLDELAWRAADARVYATAAPHIRE